MSHRPNRVVQVVRPSNAPTFRFLCLLLVLCVALPGCGGCQKQQQNAGGKGKSAQDKKDKDEEDREKKKREIEKPPLELARFQIQPTDEDSVQFFIKPGHFISTLHSMRANHDDVQADFETSVTNKTGAPLQLEHAPFRVTASRPVALPKSQVKFIETFYFVPREASSSDENRYSLHRRLVPRSGARREILELQGSLTMPDYQFYMVILADVPDRYAFIKGLHSIKPPVPEFDDQSRPKILYYRVFAPKNLQRGAPLPTHPMAWTGTAYVLWDNVYPNVLSLPQQQAMIDWLHWGGQLIISGPGSLERLKGSFLEPYLPLTSDGAADLTSADFEELNSHWSLLNTKGERQLFPINQGETAFGVDLKPTDRGAYVAGCGRLVCEGAVGSGRIVVTAFSLTDRRAMNWKCYDGFFNGCLLRRPGREFKPGAYGDIAEIVWNQFPSLAREPLLISKMRFLSRDAAGIPRVANEGADIEPSTAAKARDVWRITGYGGQGVAGVGAWNDFGSISSAARDTLKQAAGITIPESSFVLKVLVAYLFLLVPVNWAVFRLLGRVEWAWIAAPIMGIVASIAVVRMAQLDIGFARSRTEVATIEVHAGYPRAHLTRYIALYTSLTTNYVVESESDSALILPFSTDPNFTPRIHDTITTVALRRDRTVRLSGFPVISNSTGIVHSEEMYDMGGTVQVKPTAAGDWQLENSGELRIRDAVILRRTENGDLQIARQNDIQPRVSTVLRFEDVQESMKLSDLWPRSPVMNGRNLKTGEVGLHQFAEVAVRHLPLRAGETRLIGWNDQPLKGFVIRPEANQTMARTLVVVHLNPGPLSPAQLDTNLYADIVAEEPEQPLTDENVGPLELLPQQ